MLTRIKAKVKLVIFLLLDKFSYFYSIYESEVNDRRIFIHPSTYGYRKSTFKLFRKDDYIEIGKFCSLADDVTMIASGEHYITNVSTFPFHDRSKLGKKYKDTLSKGSIIIGNDVWVGHAATILSGVKVGNGAVIAAGSIVINDVPDYAIVAGVPAKVVKYRFSQNQIDKLLEIRWWEWDEDTIHSNKDDFYLPVDEFISKYLTMEP